MTTISELRKMSIEGLKQYRINLVIGFPPNFHEFTIFVIDKIIEEKNEPNNKNSTED